MGQRSERRAQTHPRDSTTSLPPFSATTSPFGREESMGDLQETTIVRTEESRSGTQEIKVWAPQLKQLKDRDWTTLQCLLDLSDWRVLYMTSTRDTVQWSTEWVTQGLVRGSRFKITPTVLVRDIPTTPQLEKIRVSQVSSKFALD